MSFWKKLFGGSSGTIPAIQGKPYWNKEWNFGLTIPNDWEVLFENEVDLSNLSALWSQPVRVAGPKAVRARPGVTVVATIVKDDGKGLAAYMDKAERDLRSGFSDFEILSKDGITLLGWPSAWMSYIYRGGSGPMFELNVTTFFGGGQQLWFQFLCETDRERAKEDFPIFQSIINSLSVGAAGFRHPQVRLSGTSHCGLCSRAFGSAQPHAMLNLKQGRLMGVCDDCRNAA